MRARLLEQRGESSFKDLGAHELTARPLKGELLLLQEEHMGCFCQFRVVEAIHNVAHPDGQAGADGLQLVLSRVLTDSQMSRQVERYFDAATGRQPGLFEPHGHPPS